MTNNDTSSGSSAMDRANQVRHAFVCAVRGGPGQRSEAREPTRTRAARFPQADESALFATLTKAAKDVKSLNADGTLELKDGRCAACSA